MPSVVRAWHNRLLAEHPTTAHDAYRLLRAVMNTAVDDRAIAQNPCKVKGAGILRTPERPVATFAELDVAAAHPRYRLAFLLAAWCQLRRNDILGLQRDDVDELRTTSTVRRAVTTPGGRSPHVGPPKTDAGIRTLTIPPNVMPRLCEHMAHYVGPASDAWIFGTSTGGMIEPRNLSREWARVRLAAGRPDLPLHHLRHSGLTWAAAAGESAAELMRRGGHSSAAAAMRYQHATEDRDRVIADALAAFAPLAPVVELRAERAATD